MTSSTALTTMPQRIGLLIARSNARYHPRPKAVGCIPRLDPGLQAPPNPLEDPSHRGVVVQTEDRNYQRQHHARPMSDCADNRYEHKDSGQKAPASDRQGGSSATNRSEATPGHRREE